MPDELMENLLKAIFGSGSIIVLGFVVANFVSSWIDALKSGAKATSSALDAGHRFFRWLRQVPPGAVLVGLIVSAAMLPLQALWLWASYVVGNGLSYMFLGGRGMRNGPDWNIFTTSLHWDWVAELYVAVAVLVLGYAYVTAWGGDGDRRGRGVGFLLAPLVPIGALTLLGSLLAGLDYLFYSISDEGNVGSTVKPEAKDFGIKCLAITAMIVAYTASSYAVVGTPNLIARIWRPAAKTPETAFGFPSPPPVSRSRSGGHRKLTVVVVVTALVVGGITLKNHLDASRRAAAVKAAQFTAEGSTLENAVKSTAVDCYTALGDGDGSTEDVVRHNRHYACNRIPLTRKDHSDSYWTVISLKTVDATLASRHGVQLVCSDGGLFTASSAASPPIVATALHVLVGGYASERTAAVPSITCTIGSDNHVVRQVQIKRAIDASHRFQT